MLVADEISDVVAKRLRAEGIELDLRFDIKLAELVEVIGVSF